MEKRRLGKSGFMVNPVGLGCMGFSHAYGDPTDRKTAVETIRKAYDIGYDFFDTAECYTGINADGSISYNEQLVGEALKDIRDKVIIATKFGVTHSPAGLITDSSPERIRRSVEGSLEKLGTDYIDLYYQHRVDPNVEPETVAQVMGELIREGKIRAWGISEVSEDYLRRADAITPVTAIENRYSMMARDYENMFPVLEEMDIAYVAFSPMANGFLTGAYTPQDTFKEGVDYRSRMKQYTEEGYNQAKPLLDYLNALAEEKNAAPGQISLAWMICKKPYIFPIPGSRKLHRLEENFLSGNVVLSPDEISAIDEKLDTLQFAVYGR